MQHTFFWLYDIFRCSLYGCSLFSLPWLSISWGYLGIMSRLNFLTSRKLPGKISFWCQQGGFILWIFRFSVERTKFYRKCSLFSYILWQFECSSQLGLRFWISIPFLIHWQICSLRWFVWTNCFFLLKIRERKILSRGIRHTVDVWIIMMNVPVSYLKNVHYMSVMLKKKQFLC